MREWTASMCLLLLVACARPTDYRRALVLDSVQKTTIQQGRELIIRQCWELRQTVQRYPGYTLRCPPPGREAQDDHPAFVSEPTPVTFVSRR